MKRALLVTIALAAIWGIFACGQSAPAQAVETAAISPTIIPELSPDCTHGGAVPVSQELSQKYTKLDVRPYTSPAVDVAFQMNKDGSWTYSTTSRVVAHFTISGAGVEYESGTIYESSPFEQMINAWYSCGVHTSVAVFDRNTVLSTNRVTFLWTYNQR